ncbi:hypothetical protein N7467_005426 [Penicillium canescens]|nr:hypothetical protein N7467_005426 [Penicillium canescens]
MTMRNRQELSRYQWILVFLVLEILAAALMFFFLTIAASVWAVGMVFVALDGLCAVLLLIAWSYDWKHLTSRTGKSEGQITSNRDSHQGATAV